MPWKPRNLIEEREAFVTAVETGTDYFATLCRSFGISRTTGYKWLARYRESGHSRSSLEDLSRRPRRIRTVAEETVNAVLRLRAESGLGARKLSAILHGRDISVGPSTVHRILSSNGCILDWDERQSDVWIHETMVADDLEVRIVREVPSAVPASGFADRIKSGTLHDRKKAIAVLASLKGMPVCTIMRCLDLTFHTIKRYNESFANGGFHDLFRPRKSKIDDSAHKDVVFAVLHSPPAASGFNRTSWRMVDLQTALREKGHVLSEARIRRILKVAGFRWRRARIVLTSNDPKYEEKLQAVKSILATLTPYQAFFSIDEYGPFAIKQKPGRKLIEPGKDYVVPQRQKSKGWLIMTAALELLRNQVTHFYSRTKDTGEMIKMADLLRSEYQSCSKLYLSWDAASWHIPKALVAHLEELNAGVAHDCGPTIELAPLPAGAQFLNVIESVFSGMSRAIIHNSDYPSVDAAKDAIDQYFTARNLHFQENPRRAGLKIWGEERVLSEFSEGQNCKDPKYR